MQKCSICFGSAIDILYDSLMTPQCRMLPVLTCAHSMHSGYHYDTALLGQIKQILMYLVTTIEQWHRDSLCSLTVS
jgi:hypothetical protein